MCIRDRHSAYYNTTDGILEKENPEDREFVVPAKLKELIQKKAVPSISASESLPLLFRCLNAFESLSVKELNAAIMFLSLAVPREDVYKRQRWMVLKSHRPIWNSVEPATCSEMRTPAEKRD